MLSTKTLIVFSLIGAALTSCTMSSPRQEQANQATTTPLAHIVPYPTPTYFIPEKKPRESVIATLPKAEFARYSDIEIARLLLEELLTQMKAKEASDIYKIENYEITYFSHRNKGYFDACYVITPSSDEFFMVHQQELADGRVKICYLFSVAQDQNTYYLSGYFGG